MKEIPCRRCGREALGPPTAEMPNGQPIRFGRFTGGMRPIVLKCYRCGDSFKVDALMFNGLPEVVDES